MDDARMYIGRFAQQAGTTAKTVRYYEDLGLLAGAARSETGYRLYGAADLERLSFVLGAKALGQAAFHYGRGSAPGGRC
jgi:MerR family Zn(II)-responsive transcriptional regulator of zntA